MGRVVAFIAYPFSLYYKNFFVLLFFHFYFVFLLMVAASLRLDDTSCSFG